MAGTGVFVGREGELSRLQSALGERARLILVVGDAGIGKTRFVAEGLARASASGLLTIAGGCLPLAVKPPLLPIADALAELSRLDGGGPFEAALVAAPPYVRPELARLLPRLAEGDPVAAEPVEAWRYERLFAGVAELLDGVVRRSPLVLLVDDLHWADAATLDFLTYVVRAGRGSTMSVVVTCRSDEVPLDARVADWLVHVRRDASVEEIRLGPFSQSEVAEQVAALVEASPPGELVAEWYARAEGHPFFTEQLVAAALTDSGRLAQPVAVPARLAELLVARASSCGDEARAVLAALAVAGRPLSERRLGDVTGLDEDTVRAAVHELTAARLLATPAEGAYRPRHALLAEAVTADLLPGEQVSLHERLAQALQAAGGESLAAEAAGHWAAAGRTGEELQARLTAANAAAQVFAYTDAAAHWQRAIDLCKVEAGADLGEDTDVPHLYIRAVDALDASGEHVRASAVADEAYRRYADYPDPTTAAVIHLRAGYLRALDSPTDARPLMNEALRLFEGTPPSVEHAKAWFWYGDYFLSHIEGARSEEIIAAFNRALETAEAAGAATLIPQILCLLAVQLFDHGEVEEGFRLLARAQSAPEASRDPWAVLTLAITQANALFSLGRLEEATQVGLRGVEAARQGGMGDSLLAHVLVANAVESLHLRGRTAEAAVLIDPSALGPIDRDNMLLHQCRAQIDLLRGEVDVAAELVAQTKVEASLDFSRGTGELIAEVALWAGRPEDALREVQQLLDRLAGTEWVLDCGWLLAAGMGACADLAERGRTRCDDNAVGDASAAADGLVAWVDREADVPFAEHAMRAANPAVHATWDAERTRASGVSDPAGWSVAAERWEALDYRHRAAYARWRQAEALLAAPHGGRAAAGAALSTAADLAVGHVPLMKAIEALARRARIDLSVPADVDRQNGLVAVHPFGLTDRELEVLRLLGQGKTNPEIATALFISPRTVGVHVTHILRKLDAATRVHAATVAERAGLLDAAPTHSSAR